MEMVYKTHTHRFAREIEYSREGSQERGTTKQEELYCAKNGNPQIKHLDGKRGRIPSFLALVLASAVLVPHKSL